MSTFELKITLGNAAMQTDEDVAAALRAAADYIAGVGTYEQDGEIRWHLDAGRVRDVNGNTVGEWAVERDGAYAVPGWMNEA